MSPGHCGPQSNSPDDDYLGSSQFGAMLNDATINMGVKWLVGHSFSFLLGRPKSSMSWARGKSMLRLMSDGPDGFLKC